MCAPLALFCCMLALACRNVSGDGNNKGVADKGGAGAPAITPGARFGDAELGFSFVLPAALQVERARPQAAFPFYLRDRTGTRAFRITIERRAGSAATDRLAQHRHVNPKGHAYFLYPELGQETGAPAAWALLLPGPGWFVTLRAQPHDKPLLESIAATLQLLPATDSKAP